MSFTKLLVVGPRSESPRLQEEHWPSCSSRHDYLPRRRSEFRVPPAARPGETEQEYTRSEVLPAAMNQVANQEKEVNLFPSSEIDKGLKSRPCGTPYHLGRRLLFSGKPPK